MTHPADVARIAASIANETRDQRWARLHRIISEAGRIPARTLEGCELQAAMLADGRLPLLPPPTKDQLAATESSKRRKRERDIARLDEQDAYTAWQCAEYRETARQRRDEKVVGPESLRYAADDAKEQL